MGIVMLVALRFSNGLTPSLIGNVDRKINVGLKTLQLLGNSMSDHYPTHAEQFNQNTNSQRVASANIARQSVGTFRYWMAVALMMGVQAVYLSTRLLAGHCDAREYLSPDTVRLYVTVLDIVGVVPSSDRRYVNDDTGLQRDQQVAAIVEDLAAHDGLSKSVADFVDV